MMLFAPIVLARMLVVTSLAGANINKSRIKQCAPGLVVRAIVDRIGRRTTHCVLPSEPGHIDPLHHAKHFIEGATHVVRVPSAEGYEYLATHGVVQKTTQGDKLERIAHPVQHFEDDMHAIAIHPDSHALGHTPEQAYHHAVGKLLVRGADGETFGIAHPIKRDTQGHPRVYRVYRDAEYQSKRRMGGRKAETSAANARGTGIDVNPAQLAYLQSHPPKKVVSMGANGQVFASSQRIALPAVDSDGQPIPGRPLRVRYDIELDPWVYGAGYADLATAPGRGFTEDEPKADQRFRSYTDGLRRRLFPREDDRPAAGSIDELIRRHNGDVNQVIESGDLGHRNVAKESRKQRTVGMEKPLGRDELQRLVGFWRAQHPALIDGIHQQVKRKVPSFNDSAEFDNAVDDGIESAIHRFDPQVGKDFVRYARSIVRGHVMDAAQRRGAEYGAERDLAHVTLPSFRDEGAAEHDDDDEAAPPRKAALEPAPAANDNASSRPKPTPSQPKPKLRIYDPNLGSQAEFGKVLEQVLPAEAEQRRVIAALYPTGNFIAGARYKEAAQKTGLPQEHFFQYLPVVQRIKAHPEYRRYFERQFKVADEERHEAEALERGLDPEAPSLIKVVSAIDGEGRHLELAKRLRVARPER
jgi:hypothetical protein